MKKLLLLTLLVALILPITSHAFGFLNITGAQLTHLSGATYRLRVNYDWGGDLLNAFISPSIMLGPPTPQLNSFNVTGGGTGFNFFNQAGKVSLISNRLLFHSLLSTGNQFGFDFTSTDPLATSFTFLDQGKIDWYESTQYRNGSFLPPTYCFSESFNGKFTLPTDPTAVPEPASALLLGLGLAGAVIVKRRK